MLAQAQPGTFLVHLNNTTATTLPLSPGSQTPFKIAGGFMSAGGSSWTCSVMGTDHTVHHLAVSLQVCFFTA